MSYPYSAENRLDVPHAYMYAPFGGRTFLHAYVADREKRLAARLPFGHLRPSDSFAPRLIEAARRRASLASPHAFSPGGRTELQPLLAALLASLARGDLATAQPWLNRILQRFEVSKKLYTAYAPSFRKGEGEMRDPACYAELALCLALAYSMSGHLQYLSTLLKLVDLLLSLDSQVLRRGCSSELLDLLVSAELDAVRALAARQGVSLDAE
ncbi:MAG: hypothetical protein IPJ99_17330 [Betaproteobacteria bacterium]|nr:hypothetical protein [Betaproteobacteria bacterium]